MKLEPGAKLGPYQILGELGRGGMATVFRAYQPNLEREVAIKILPEFLVEQPGFKARFHREAVAVARLQHPNILSVYDHGEQDGITYIVSEYVEGGTLASRMGAPIQLDYVVRILRPVADALDYAHSEGVIHRDVKPSNVLLDRRGVPILSDFGLARVQQEGEQRLTQTGAMVGTPTYMAPEQCSGGEVGPPADIYALAVIAYEMVTGRVPFSGTNPLSIIAAHQMTPPPSPRKFNPSLPASIEQPLLAGLAKDPARRPETAIDFVDALAAAIPSGASQYPMTPPPAAGLPIPPTPTAIAPPASTSYPSVASTPSAAQTYAEPAAAPPSSAQLTPAPASAPQYTPPPAAPQYTPPPSSPQYSPPPYSPPPYVAPPSSPAVPVAPSYQPPMQYTAAAPPPSYPAVPMQQQYTPAPGYAPAQQQQWTPPAPAAGRAGRGAVIGLWIVVVFGAVVAIAAVIASLNTSMDSTTRWLWVAFGVIGALAAGGALAGVLTVGVRDASGRAPAAGIRFGSAGALGLILLLMLGGSSAYGFSQQTPANPVAQSTPSPKACTILQPGTPLSANAVGSDCGFTVASTAMQVDCRTAKTLPGTLQSGTHDFNTDALGPGGLTIDSTGCHLAAPSYKVDANITSVANLDAVPTLMVIDFQEPDLSVTSAIGMLVGCDDGGCVEYVLLTSTPEVDIYQDGEDSPLAYKKQPPVAGTNRMMLVLQGQQVRIWFNGSLLLTQQISRVHKSGTYAVFLLDLDKSAAAAATVTQMGVYKLAQ